jgi:hypothetical protein
MRNIPAPTVMCDGAGWLVRRVATTAKYFGFLKLVDDEDANIRKRERRSHLLEFEELAAIHYPVTVLLDDVEAVLIFFGQPE